MSPSPSTFGHPFFPTSLRRPPPTRSSPFLTQADQVSFLSLHHPLTPNTDSITTSGASGTAMPTSVRTHDAAEVGRHAAVALCGQVLHLVAPRVPELREAVQEHHHCPRAPLTAALRHVHRNAVRFHRLVPNRDSPSMLAITSRLLAQFFSSGWCRSCFAGLPAELLPAASSFYLWWSLAPLLLLGKGRKEQR